MLPVALIMLLGFKKNINCVIHQSYQKNGKFIEHTMRNEYDTMTLCINKHIRVVLVNKMNSSNICSIM